MLFVSSVGYDLVHTISWKITVINRLKVKTISKFIRIKKSTTCILKTNKEKNLLFTKNHDSKFQRSECKIAESRNMKSINLTPISDH